MNLQTTLLRSVSLADDLREPSRLAHFRPTRRGLPIVRAVMKPGAATLVVAPYGSGKSLAAGVAALGVRNDSVAHGIVAPMLPRIAAIDLALEARMAERMQSDRRGAVLTLTGHVPDLAAALAACLGMVDPPPSLDGVLDLLGRHRSADHLAIVWDEFGRHLEGLVGAGRARDLGVVQRLAEWSARAAAPSASLSLLLHQDLLAYATRLNQTAQSEWRKVEGRFAQVRYVEDSREIYALVADLVSEIRPNPPDPGACRAIEEAAPILARSGWFDGLRDQGDVSLLLHRAHPLSAGALQALPGVAARVGQNERGMFTFLNEADLSRPVGVDAVFERFSDAMRSDVGVGGTFQRWLATENARAHADGPAEREALAAACLLRLGRDGETRRLRRADLVAALGTAGFGKAGPVVDALAHRKLVWWSARDDDLSVWRGSDVDLGQLVREHRARIEDGFDLQAFLSGRAYAPVVRPHRHNTRLGVNRHLRPSLLMASRFLRAAGGGSLPDTTPSVTYLVPSTVAERDACFGLLAAGGGAGPHAVVVVPESPIDLGDAALEVLAIEVLQADQAVLARDPFVARELAELLALANVHFGTAVRRLVDPRGEAAAWFHGGKRLPVSADRPAPAAISTLFDGWFPSTPRIANDQLVRDRISRQMRTTRVRVSRRVLENWAVRDLGFDLRDRSAELSVYRTVLRNTGLHIPDSGGARLARPEEVVDDGLREAWRVIESFLTDESARPKPFAELSDALRSPPFGVSAGVLPLLAAAGYSAFARAVSVTQDGRYLPDMLGFDIDRIFEDPSSFAIRVLPQDCGTLAYLDSLVQALGGQAAAGGHERVRLAYDALGGFLGGLPAGARRTKRLGRHQSALLEALLGDIDPAQLFLGVLPELAGGRQQVVPAIEALSVMLRGLSTGNTDAAGSIVADILALGDGAVPATMAGWVSCLDAEALLAREDVRITDKALVRLAVAAAAGGDQAAMVGALSSILLQRGLNAWDDASPARFRAALREARSRIEDAAIDAPQVDARMRPILEERIERLRAALLRSGDAGGTPAPGLRPKAARRGRKPGFEH